MTAMILNRLDAIYGSLNIAVFTVTEANQLTLVASPPAWLSLYFDGLKAGGRVDINDDFPFLQNFLVDAELHWQSGQPLPAKSGPWVETWPEVSNGCVLPLDELLLSHGDEAALEATALLIGGEKTLLITLLGNDYQVRQGQMQILRDNLLTQQQLQIEVHKRTAEIRRREKEISYRVLAAIAKRDEATAAHIYRVGLYVEAMAHALELDQYYIDDLRLAAPMHDLGKIAIPDKILLKRGWLSYAEFEVMKTHTEIGSKVLKGSGIPVLDLAAEIAESHHEKWDGSGYPNGLVARQIPLGARILAIVDVYDALANERRYKPAYSEAETFSIMQKGKNSHFDPELLEVFFRISDRIKQINEEHPDEFMSNPNPSEAPALLIP